MNCKYLICRISNNENPVKGPFNPTKRVVTPKLRTTEIPAESNKNPDLKRQEQKGSNKSVMVKYEMTSYSP